MAAETGTTTSTRGIVWSGWVVAAMLLLPVLDGGAYLAAVAGSGLVLAAIPGLLPVRAPAQDRDGVAIVLGLFVVVTGLMALAFRGFGTDHVVGLFLSFAAALLLGVAGPVVHTVWVRGRPLSDLGLGAGSWPTTATLALLFAGVQFGLTLWGFDLPAAEDWVPLLVMALVVGVFESVFFRGYVQNRLEERLGPVAGVGGAAALYGLYHVGYGMGADEMLFLGGLGVVYAVAFALARSVLVLWPLLTPLGSFFANVEAGDIELPWASILGFADVLGLMVLVLWLAHRRWRRLEARATAPETVSAGRSGPGPSP